MKSSKLLIGALALAFSPWCAAIGYTYDELNRLAAVSYDNGTTISYGYDAAGNLLSLATTVAAAPPVPGPVPTPTPAPTPSATITVPTGGTATVTGTTAVTANEGSTVVIPTGIASTGATIALPTPSAGGVAPVPVSITVNGQKLTATPTSPGTVLGVKTVTVNGVSTQVLSVISGSVSVTASQPNQQLLAVGGGSGSNAVVVTADTVGTVATSTVKAGTGETFIVVSSGVVTLPTNAFADANSFAAIKDGKLYAGEIAQLDANGKVAQVRLGSMGGSAAIVGDPIKTPSAAGLGMNVSVPNLTGTVARISATQEFTEVIAAALGATAKGQNTSGVLSLATSAGGSINALPVGDITVDTNRADGVTVSGNGRKEVVRSGVIVNLVPAVADIAQLTGQVTALDKVATITANDYGVLQANLNGVTYGVQPGWSVAKANGGSAGFGTDAQGNVVYQDSAGNLQTLYPVFVDLGQIIAAFKPTDAYASATGNADGTVTAKYLGVSYMLMPDYTLLPVPAAHATEAWWLDGGKVYVRSSDGKTAQGFGVK